MNGLLWEGVFASEGPALPLTAAAITVVLPLTGIISGLSAGMHRWMAIVGLLCSAGSIFITGALLVYFLNNLPVC